MTTCACALRGGTYTAHEVGDCNDEDPQAFPGADEKCNGSDDDCDDDIDEDEPAIMCLGQVPDDFHGVVGCEGECLIAECDGPYTDPAGQHVPGWYDLNGVFEDGCECQEDMHEAHGGHECTEAEYLGEIQDSGSMIIINGNLAPAGDEDWFAIKAIDTTWDEEPEGCDHFNFQVKFVENPGEAFRFDVYRGSCLDEHKTCSGGTISQWAVNFQDSEGGECKCSTNVEKDCKAPEDYEHCVKVTGTQFKCGACPGFAAMGMHACSDNSNTYLVRVFREGDKAATCDDYELELSNGLYM